MTYFCAVPIDSSYHTTDTTLNETIYGISNESLMPIRKAEVQQMAEQPIEQLYHPSPHIINVASWQIFVLLGAVSLLGFVKAFSNNRFKQGVKALFNYGVAQEITREEKVFFHRSNLLFTAMHLLTTALFIYQLKEIINTGDFAPNNFGLFLLILAFLVVLYIVKYLFSKVLLFVLPK